jgi:phenolic acid decarboxylase
MNEFEKLPKILQTPEIKWLFEVTDVDSLTKEERRRYDVALKHYRDSMSVIAYSKQKGRQEAEKTIAKRMKLSNFNAVEIANITGLPLEEVERL